MNQKEFELQLLKNKNLINRGRYSMKDIIQSDLGFYTNSLIKKNKIQEYCSLLSNIPSDISNNIILEKDIKEEGFDLSFAINNIDKFQNLNDNYFKKGISFYNKLNEKEKDNIFISGFEVDYKTINNNNNIIYIQPKTKEKDLNIESIINIVNKVKEINKTQAKLIKKIIDLSPTNDGFLIGLMTSRKTEEIKLCLLNIPKNIHTINFLKKLNVFNKNIEDLLLTLRTITPLMNIQISIDNNNIIENIEFEIRITNYEQVNKKNKWNNILHLLNKKELIDKRIVDAATNYNKIKTIKDGAYPNLNLFRRISHLKINSNNKSIDKIYFQIINT